MIILKYIVKLFLGIWLFAVLIYSCADEKRLERRLSGRTWNIERADWEKTSITATGTTINSGSQNNAGYFTFDSEGSGSSYMIIDGKAENASFTWKNTEDDVTLTHNTNITGTTVTTRTISANETGRRRMKWSYTETKTDANGQHTYIINLELTRN